MTHIYKGIVEKGGGRATALGFPTVNIPLADVSVSGIYAACVLLRGRAYGAAAYADLRRKVLEAHLLDFGGDLVGEEIVIELKEKIRDDARFADDAALAAAIKDDTERVREYCALHPCSPVS